MKFTTFLLTTFTIMLLAAFLGMPSTGCTNAQVDAFQRANEQIASAATQPTVQAFKTLPVIGDYVEAGGKLISAVLKLINPFLDLLRPPSAVVPR